MKGIDGDEKEWRRVDFMDEWKVELRLHIDGTTVYIVYHKVLRGLKQLWP